MRPSGRLLYEEPIADFSFRKARFIKALLVLYGATTLLLIIFILGVVDYSIYNLEFIEPDPIKLTLVALLFFTCAGGGSLLNYYIEKGGIQRVRIYDESIVVGSVPIDVIWDTLPYSVPLQDVDKAGAGYDNANYRYVVKVYHGTYRFPWFIFKKNEYKKVLKILGDDLKVDIVDLE